MLHKYNLERIIGSKNKIRLIRFLSKNKGWQFNLSEISKKTFVDKGALSRLIKEFESNKIFEVKRSGKLLLFKLDEKNKLVSNLIVPFFEKEARA
jgi:DNA-binding MarR family transcriptional regulator